MSVTKRETEDEKWARRDREYPGVTIPMTPTEAELVEKVAEAIYERFPFTASPVSQRPKWVPHGNSFKQDEARDYARAIIPIVREAERERCAKVAADEEELRLNQINASKDLQNGMRELLIARANTAAEIAAAIRNKGNPYTQEDRIDIHRDQEDG